MSARTPSDECLCALIDGELLPGEADALLAQARTDPALRQRLADLGLTKTMLRNAYADPPAPPAPRARSAPPAPQGSPAPRAARPAAEHRRGRLIAAGRLAWRGAAAAGLLLAGVAAGWWLHGHGVQALASTPVPATSLLPAQGPGRPAPPAAGLGSAADVNLPAGHLAARPRRSISAFSLP